MQILNEFRVAVATVLIYRVHTIHQSARCFEWIGGMYILLSNEFPIHRLVFEWVWWRKGRCQLLPDLIKFKMPRYTMHYFIYQHIRKGKIANCGMWSIAHSDFKGIKTGKKIVKHFYCKSTIPEKNVRKSTWENLRKST